MDIYAVDQGSGNPFLITGDGGRGAGALLNRVAEKAAGAGVHGGYQHEIGGKGEGALGPADGDGFILQRLAEHLQDPAAELGEFIQEKDSPVGKGNFPRLRPGSPADQSGMGDGVVRRAKRALLDEGGFFGKFIQDGVYLGDVQCFVDGHSRHNPGQRAG